MRPSPERRGAIVGCLYLEIEGQSWLVDTVDRGLMKIDQLGCLTKKEAENILNCFVFIIATVLETWKYFRKQFQKTKWKLFG